MDGEKVRLTVRMPRELFEALAAAAEEDGRSLAAEARVLLRKSLEVPVERVPFGFGSHGGD